MIALALPARAEAHAPYVGRISRGNDVAVGALRIVETAPGTTVLAGPHGLVAIDHDPATDLVGDVILVVPAAGRVERLIRHGSMHNSLLVTERCDQLCVMCSQPPKKTHDDRFAFFEEACLLADRDAVIGITGGEPTLFKDALLAMIERVLEARPDLAFHVLTNGQHFDATDAERLAQSAYRRVQWGIPLYADDPETHDTIVGKPGAFARLEDSLATLACAGAGIELPTIAQSTMLIGE